MIAQPIIPHAIARDAHAHLKIRLQLVRLLPDFIVKTVKCQATC